MSTVTVTDRTLTISLTTAEKVAGLHRDVQVPLAAVTAVEVVPDALAAVRGVRAPGLAWPGLRKVGTWRSKGGAEFVVAAHRQPGVRVRLQGQKLDSLLVGTPDAVELARTIEAAR